MDIWKKGSTFPPACLERLIKRLEASTTPPISTTPPMPPISPALPPLETNKWAKLDQGKLLFLFDFEISFLFTRIDERTSKIIKHTRQPSTLLDNPATDLRYWSGIIRQWDLHLLYTSCLQIILPNRPKSWHASITRDISSHLFGE